MQHNINFEVLFNDFTILIYEYKTLNEDKSIILSIRLLQEVEMSIYFFQGSFHGILESYAKVFKVSKQWKIVKFSGMFCLINIDQKMITETLRQNNFRNCVYFEKRHNYSRPNLTINELHCMIPFFQNIY